MAELDGSRFLEDGEIIKRIGARDGAAERVLLEKYGGFILAVARGQGLSECDAEEVANDVLLESIEQARAGYLKASSLRPWLRKVTKNRAIDRHRRNGTVREHDEEVIEELRLSIDCPGTARGEDDRVYTYKLVVVRQALRRLRNREARRIGARSEAGDTQVLVWIAHRVSNEELAEYLGTNENAARQRRHRALERLKEEMRLLQEEMNDFAEEL